MISAAIVSVHRLASGSVDASVMRWSCPVPYFGRLSSARVATLGINPSNREFVDSTGSELDGAARRFPTLTSLGIEGWGAASHLELAEIVKACDQYFTGNPYDRWFRVLDSVIRLTGSSYYSREHPAAHLDLVPYATNEKWGHLRPEERRVLLRSGSGLLGLLLRESSVELIILNGRSVVREFENICDVALTEEYCSDWDLPRGESPRVPGIGYVGQIERVGSVELGRSVSVLGFNHNVQSSFGVTRGTLHAIANWVGKNVT